MRQHLVTLLLAVLITTSISAQESSTKREADEFYGKGGKKETVTIIYPDGTKEVTVRFFDPDGRVRQYKRTTTNKDGSSVEEHISYDCKGKKTDSELIKKDANGDGEYYRAEIYSSGPDNELIEGYISEKNANGETEISTFNRKTGQYEKAAKSGPQPDKPVLQPNSSTCPLPDFKFELFGGYSLLLADFDPESEKLHGWIASIFYNFSPRWSAGLSFSQHSKSPENQKFRINFFHADLKYDFVKRDEGAIRFNPFLSMGLGISSYRSEVEVPGVGKFESDDKSFCPKISAGFDFELAKKLALQAEASYVPTRFNDQTQHHVRANAGLLVGLFRHQRNFSN